MIRFYITEAMAAVAVIAFVSFIIFISQKGYNMDKSIKETETLVEIYTILKELPQPDREYILELLKHWQKIR